MHVQIVPENVFWPELVGKITNNPSFSGENDQLRNTPRAHSAL